MLNSARPQLTCWGHLFPPRTSLTPFFNIPLMDFQLRPSTIIVSGGFSGIDHPFHTGNDFLGRMHKGMYFCLSEVWNFEVSLRGLRSCGHTRPLSCCSIFSKSIFPQTKSGSFLDERTRSRHTPTRGGGSCKILRLLLLVKDLVSPSVRNNSAVMWRARSDNPSK